MPVEPDAPAGHTAWVSSHAHWRGPDMHRARCECGWFATPRHTLVEALADRREHWATVTAITLW